MAEETWQEREAREIAERKAAMEAARAAQQEKGTSSAPTPDPNADFYARQAEKKVKAEQEAAAAEAASKAVAEADAAIEAAKALEGQSYFGKGARNVDAAVDEALRGRQSTDDSQ